MQRRLHLGVAALRVLAPAQILERVVDRHPLRRPERRARRVLGHVEEVELRAEPPVVAAPRALEPLEVRVEVLLGVERRAVDARELLVRRVAAPVRAGEAGQLERLDRLRVLQVRAAAEIGEVAAVSLRVEGDVALGGVDELELVRLVLGLEELPRLVARDLAALPACGLPSARAGSPPRSARDPPRGSAPGSRSRSRSRSRSAARSRASRPGRGASRPRRAGAPRSGGGRRARRDRPCRASSGAGSDRRRAAAGAGPAPARRRARARPARRASARSRARRRAPTRRREVRAPSCREGRPSSRRQG